MRSVRPLRRFTAVTTVSLAVAGLGLPAAFAQPTPEPIPVDPEQPPGLVVPPQPGPIAAEVGTGIGMVRVLPGTVPGESIFDDPAYEDALRKQSLIELGLGLAKSKADSESYLAHEHAVAEAAPFGAAIGGYSPQPPGLPAIQTAVPDHPEPTVTGVRPPASPADALLKLGLLEGSAHARWDERLGPCVSPISEASSSLGSLSAVNVLPALPDTPEQFAELPPAEQAAGLDQGGAEDAQSKLAGDLPGSLARLGGLLSGGAPTESGAGSLLHVPDAVRAQSRIELVDVPGSAGKAVRATSAMQLASVRLLSGTPQELRVDVVSEPKLTVTATGDPETSTVDYEAPVLRVSQGGRELVVIDAANPTADLPIGLPGAPGELPIVGPALNDRVLDIGVLRLSIGELTQEAQGAELRAGARLFDLKLLPGTALGMPDAALAHVTFGEQTARAGAPEGGVVCDAPAEPAPVPASAQGAAAPPLAKTSGAYYTIPLFWTGTGLLLLGAVLVAAAPRRRH
ncbi:hypothetical protein [Saccharopolyspora gloriosae]|uniref:hypothetical protein n=1 Tax=Saccharopolyspora gloriosae TaxID=455344 RepID=UPI001FB821D2|nr:hypothetical protein [Saccharopolyspora gloriosae]